MTIPTQSRQRILVVDDETSVRQTVKLILEHDTYQIQTADSGTEALTILDQERHDLVITDFTMPGMKGDELARIIHERWPETGIVMLTACAETLRASPAPLPGVDVLLSKPFAVEQFRKTVATMLRETGYTETMPPPSERLH